MPATAENILTPMNCSQSSRTAAAAGSAASAAPAADGGTIGSTASRRAGRGTDSWGSSPGDGEAIDGTKGTCVSVIGDGASTGAGPVAGIVSSGTDGSTGNVSTSAGVWTL